MSIKFPPPGKVKLLNVGVCPGRCWSFDLTDTWHLFDRHQRQLFRQLRKSYTMSQYKAFGKSRGALESKRKHDGLAKLVNLTKHWGWTVTSWKTSAEADPKIRLQESEQSQKTSLFLKNKGCGQKQKLDLKSLALKGFGLQDVVQLFPMVESEGRNFSGKVLVLRARRLLYSVLYRKIPKICPGAYILQRPFLRGLYSGGGGSLSTEGDLRCKIDLRLALYLEGNLPVLLCFTLWAYIWRGDLREGFCVTSFGGLIFGGDYTGRGLFSEFYGSFNEEMTEKETGRERKWLL